MSSEPERSVPSRRLSCTASFDALWFCYTPMHQTQQYYRTGSFDNCSKKWSAFVDCLTLKTKSNSKLQEILETREKSKSHIWTLRTPEEASENWRSLFAHLDDIEGGAYKKDDKNFTEK